MENKDMEESKITPLPITRAVLDFKRDEEDRNWVSKLENGKWVILHRKSIWIPIPGVRYNVTIEEKDSHAIGWITGFCEYPRIIIRGDRTCVMTKDPTKGPEPIIYHNIYEALEKNPDLEIIFTIYSKENKEVEKRKEQSKRIDMKIKITDTSGIEFTEESIKLNVPVNQTPQDIIAKIKREFE